MKQKETKKKDSVTQKNYQKLEKLTGEHPLKELLPDSHVSYQARTRKNGKHVGFGIVKFSRFSWFCCGNLSIS